MKPGDIITICGRQYDVITIRCGTIVTIRLRPGWLRRLVDRAQRWLLKITGPTIGRIIGWTHR